MDPAQMGEVQFALLSVWRGIRQGTFYGTKIRLPHAFVMTMLFNRNGTLKEILDRMTGLTYEHSRNLALFVGLYKACLAIARIVRIKLGDKITTARGHPTTHADAFLAGGLVGHFVWGRYSSVNSQIVMYLTVRVLMGLFRLASQEGLPIVKNWNFSEVYPLWASLTWAFVMWLYEFYPQLLVPSLTSSMDFLYHDSNSWMDPKTLQFLPGEFLPSPATAAVVVYTLLRAREKLVEMGAKAAAAKA